MFSVLNFPARVVHLIGLIAAVLVFIGPGAPNGRGAQSLHVSGRADAPVAMVRIATSGNDVTCRRGEPSKPCTTLIRAYQIAKCGDLVAVAGGIVRISDARTLSLWPEYGCEGLFSSREPGRV